METDEAKFGLAVECIGAAIKGLVLYVALVMTNFWMYQEGAGVFQPWLLMTIVPFPVVLCYIYYRWDEVVCFGLHLAAGLVWGIFGWFIITNHIYYIAALVLAIGESLINKFILGDWEARRYARRYKMQNYIKWGVIMAVLSVVMVKFSNPVSETYPISPSVCGAYMIGAFGVYVLCIVVFRYMFLQYDYFRQRDTLDEYAYRQVKRMDTIIIVVVAVVIGLSVLFVNETIVRLFNKLALTLIGLLVSAGIFGLGNLKTKQYFGGKGGVDVPQGAPAPAKQVANQFPLQGIVLVLAIAILIFLLIKIYKKFMANYSIGKDEAEYIKPEDKSKRIYATLEYEEKPDVQFANNNRGRIRKFYYKYMSTRMRKSKVTNIRGKTPQELAQLYQSPHERGQIQDATELYEKARYSMEECTDEEVTRMKALTGK